MSSFILQAIIGITALTIYAGVLYKEEIKPKNKPIKTKIKISKPKKSPSESTASQH